MKRLEIAAVIGLFLVLVGTPAAVLAGQHYLNQAPDQYTIVAHVAENGGFTPNQITVHQGEHVRLRLTSDDVSHGFQVKGLGIKVPDIYPGKYVTVEFTPTTPGTYPFTCLVWCSVHHDAMRGTIVVLPATDSGQADS